MAASRFARYWLHNGFVIVEGEKMSKSLGNFLTIRDVLDAGAGRGGALRHADDALPRSARLDRRAARARRGMRSTASIWRCAAAPEAAPATSRARRAAALEDDLNTPLALTALHDMLGELNKAGSRRAGAAQGRAARRRRAPRPAAAGARTWLKGRRERATTSNPRRSRNELGRRGFRTSRPIRASSRSQASF